jgi:hypothetical protein
MPRPLLVSTLVAVVPITAASALAQDAGCPVQFFGMVLRDLGTITSPLASPRFLAVADINMDGRADLLVATDAAGGGIRIFTGVAAPFGLSSQPTYSLTTQQVFGLAAGDLNTDAWPDLAISGASNVGWRPNNFAGFDAQISLGIGGDTAGAVAVGDINMDGRADLVIANRSATTPKLIVLTSSGIGTFNAPASWPGLAGVPLGSRIRLVDLNGDGWPDVVVGGAAPGASTGTAVTIFRNTGPCGATGFSAPAALPLSGAPGGVTVFDVADLNGDGRPDIAYAPFGVAGVRTALNAGGGFGSPVAFTAGPGLTGANVPVVSDFVIADFSNDGRHDLVGISAGPPGSQFWSTGDGAGGFAMSYSRSTGSTGTAIAAGDFDGDGRMDIAWIDQATNRLFSSLNASSLGGGITTQPPRTVSTSAGVAASITVGASSAVGSLRWYKDRAPMSDGPGVTGSATATLTITPTQADDGAVFYCRVGTCTNGAVESNFTTLRITPAPACVADLGSQGGLPGPDGFLDNNDFIIFIDAFFNHTGCP